MLLCPYSSDGTPLRMMYLEIHCIIYQLIHLEAISSPSGTLVCVCG